jgi:hypothetical protein
MAFWYGTKGTGLGLSGRAADFPRRRSDPVKRGYVRSCHFRGGCAEIAVLRPYLVPELAIWAARDTYLVAGRADALAMRENKIDVAVDWKSDVKPTTSIRAAYAGQLRDYLQATGAARGALVFMSLGEVVWVEPVI